MSEPQTANETKRLPQPSQSPDRTFHVGDPIPNALGAEQLRHVLNLAESTFYVYQRAGKLKRFEFRRPVGSKRYSGALVKRYLEQETV